MRLRRIVLALFVVGLANACSSEDASATSDAANDVAGETPCFAEPCMGSLRWSCVDGERYRRYLNLPTTCGLDCQLDQSSPPTTCPVGTRCDATSRGDSPCVSLTDAGSDALHDVSSDESDLDAGDDDVDGG